MGIGLSPILSFFLDHLVLRVALDLSGSAVADNGALFTGSAVADNRGFLFDYLALRWPTTEVQYNNFL